MAVTVSATVATVSATVNGHTVDWNGVNRNRPVNWVASIAISAVAATIATVRIAVAASSVAVGKVIKPIS